MMIDQLRTIAIFQAVAEQRSFRGAAKALGLSPSVVSHHISQLEDQLGLPLLYRSTRRMSLTDAGIELLAASQRMTAAARDGLSAIQSRVEQPIGRLTVTIATPAAQSPLSDILSDFVRLYPGIQVSFHIGDDNLNLEGSNFDVAIRGMMTNLDDSGYIAIKLGQIEFGAFASAKYAKNRPVPRTIDDLAEWDRILCPDVPWKILGTTLDGVVPTREPSVAVSCNNHALARKFLEDGLGFMIESKPLFVADVANGTLVELLPNVRFQPVDVFAIFPANSPKVGIARLFINFFKDRLQAAPVSG